MNESEQQQQQGTLWPELRVDQLTDEFKTRFKGRYQDAALNTRGFYGMTRDWRNAILIGQGLPWAMLYILWASSKELNSEQSVLTRVITQIIYFVFGVLQFQLVFVITHMTAHAEFLLEYNRTEDEPIKTVVYYPAFYHHHHHRGGKKSDWFRHLSYHEYPGETNGSINIVCAHWCSYSALRQRITYVIMAMILVATRQIPTSFVWLLMGYELGVVLLPIAHGSQHIPLRRFGALAPMIQFFQYVGIFATPEEHQRHHESGPHGAMDFSSSGLYSKWLDEQFNKVWDWAVESAKHQALMQADAHPVNFLSQFALGAHTLQLMSLGLLCICV
jgi:hypothetical protein